MVLPFDLYNRSPPRFLDLPDPSNVYSMALQWPLPGTRDPADRVR